MTVQVRFYCFVIFVACFFQAYSNAIVQLSSAVGSVTPSESTNMASLSQAQVMTSDTTHTMTETSTTTSTHMMVASMMIVASSSATTNTMTETSTTSTHMMVTSMMIVASNSIAPSPHMSSQTQVSSFYSMEPSPTPSTTQISSISGCNAQVDQVSVELSGTVTEPILAIFRNKTVNETNLYCSGQNRTSVCRLAQSFVGVYTYRNFVGCYFAPSFRRRQSTSVIRYYFTQPDNSTGTLNLEAMLDITNRALPAFTAATGLRAISVTGIRVPHYNHDHVRAAAIVGGVLGSVILILLIVFATMIIAHLVVRFVTSKNSKNNNRVRPGSESSDDSVIKDANTGGNPDTILLTQ